MTASTPDFGVAVMSLWFLLMLVGCAVYLVSFPWLLFSGARSLRRQARQLERIADAIEHANRGERDEVRELELARRNRA